MVRISGELVGPYSTYHNQTFLSEAIFGRVVALRPMVFRIEALSSRKNEFEKGSPCTLNHFFR